MMSGQWQAREEIRDRMLGPLEGSRLQNMTSPAFNLKPAIDGSSWTLF